MRWMQAHRRSSVVVTMGTGWMEEAPTAAATKEWMVTFVCDPTLRLLSEIESQIGNNGRVKKKGGGGGGGGGTGRGDGTSPNFD